MEEDIIGKKVDDLLKRSLKTSGFYIKKIDGGYSRDIDFGFQMDHTMISKFVDEVELSDVSRLAILKKLKESDVDSEIDDMISSKRTSDFYTN